MFELVDGAGIRFADQEFRLMRFRQPQRQAQLAHLAAGVAVF
jgi:hypothetical protein